MPWSLNWKVGVSVALFAAGVVSGWVTNGWRLESRLEALKASYNKEKLDAVAKARSVEIETQNKVAEIRKNHAKEVKDIRDRMQSDIDRLHNRSDRVSYTAGTCQGSSGAELSRQDAEFLTRLAAEADTLAAALQSCYKQYDTVRDQNPN